MKSHLMDIEICSYTLPIYKRGKNFMTQSKEDDTIFFGSRQKRKLFVTLSTFLYKPKVQAAMVEKYLLLKVHIISMLLFKRTLDKLSMTPKVIFR